MNPVIDRMHRTLAAQREAFLRKPYPSLAERKQKLRALKHELRPVPGRDRDRRGRRFRRAVRHRDEADRGDGPDPGSEPRAVEPASLDEAAAPSHRASVHHQQRTGGVSAEGRGRHHHAVEFSVVSRAGAAGRRARGGQSRDDQDVRALASYDGGARAECSARSFRKTRSPYSAATSRSRRPSRRCRSTTSCSPAPRRWVAM